MADLPLRGRTTALALLGQLLEHPDRRLLTLTGLPGVGKSRLAREVLAGHSGPAVALSADQIYEPGLLERRIAAAVGIPAGAGEPAPALPGDAGATDPPTDPPSTLLLVDDVHRAPDTGRTLRTLLASRRDLRLLVTARSPLRIPGETVFRLDPFPLPDPEQPAAELAQHPSVRLFVDIATATGTAAATEGAALPAIARICALVGGLPLAIELAAARSAAFSPTSLLRLLRERPPGEVLGQPAPEDDHDLFGAIAWTESLLTPDQRTLLRRLTVFRSPVPVEAIVAVAGSTDVVAGLTALVDAHLVEADHTDGATRFSLHPLVREHAHSRLVAESPEEVEQLEAAHIRWALGLVAGTSEAETAAQFLGASEQLRPVGPDLRLALHRALDRGDAAAAATLGVGLAPYWFSQGVPPGHLDLLRRAAGLPGMAEVPAGLRAMLAGWHGLLRTEVAHSADEVAAVLSDLLSAVDLARGAGDVVLLRVLGLTVRASRFAEHREAITPLCDEGRRLARELGWQPTLARFEIWTGMLAHQVGQHEQALRWAVTAYERAQGQDDPVLLLTAAGFLHTLPGARARVPELPDHDDLLALARRTGSRHIQAWLQPVAAIEAVAGGDLARGAAYASEVIEFGRAIGAWGWCGAPMICLTKVAAARGDRVQEARLHGMISQHMPVLRPSLTPAMLQAYTVSLQACREALGVRAFDSASFAGSSLTHLAAAEEALTYAESVTAAPPVMATSVNPPVIGPITIESPAPGEPAAEVPVAASPSAASPAAEATPLEPPALEPSEVGPTAAEPVTKPAPAPSPTATAPPAGSAPSGTPLLTAREQEVLAGLVAGETNKEISSSLGISPKTVMHHTSNIYRKLQVRGRSQAVAWQLRRSQGHGGTPGSPPTL